MPPSSTATSVIAELRSCDGRHAAPNHRHRRTTRPACRAAAPGHRSAIRGDRAARRTPSAGGAREKSLPRGASSSAISPPSFSSAFSARALTCPISPAMLPLPRLFLAHRVQVPSRLCGRRRPAPSRTAFERSSTAAISTPSRDPSTSRADLRAGRCWCRRDRRHWPPLRAWHADAVFTAHMAKIHGAGSGRSAWPFRYRRHPGTDC